MCIEKYTFFKKKSTDGLIGNYNKNFIMADKLWTFQSD